MHARDGVGEGEYEVYDVSCRAARDFFLSEDAVKPVGVVVCQDAFVAFGVQDDEEFPHLIEMGGAEVFTFLAVLCSGFRGVLCARRSPIC